MVGEAKWEPILDRAIDTTVHHEQFLAGLPLTGSGAKVKLVFDGEGKVAQLTYARPVLEKTGSVAIVPQSSAAELCAESLAAESLQGAVKYSAKLIYDVPADAKVGATILPSYACSGTQEVDGQVVDSQQRGRFSHGRVTVVASAPSLKQNGPQPRPVDEHVTKLSGGARPRHARGHATTLRSSPHAHPRP